MLWIAFLRKVPARNTLIGLGIAVVGLYFLLVKPSDFDRFQMNKGDVLTIICAFAWAVYIVVLPILSSKAAFRPLVFGQIVGMAVLCWAVAGVQGSVPRISSMKSFLLIVSLASACTLLTVFLQTRYQKYTSAPRAAVIYTLEPVCATMIAFVFLGEVMALREAVGAAMILLGVLFSELA